MRDPTDGLPFLTADLRGTGGEIKKSPDDFVVEEIPLYRPSGRGQHLYLLVEKERISTFEALFRLSRALGRPQSHFGVAGLKDAIALTRQYISIENVAPEAALSLEIPGVRILEAVPHKNKLKRGHLKGNRFRIRITGTGEGAAERAQAVLDRIGQKGIPNFFGSQRFGLLGNTHLLGGALLRDDLEAFADILIATPRSELDAEYDEVIALYREGDFGQALERLRGGFKYENRFLGVLAGTGGDLRKAVASLDKRIIDLYLSACQSHLFNKIVAHRIDRLDSLERGDIAFIHRNGACFLVEDTEMEAPRVEAFEISPSGPLFGSRMLKPEGEPGRREEELFRDEGIRVDEMPARYRSRLRGARRPLRNPLGHVELKEDAPGSLELSFELPPGAYATVLLREVMKTENID